MVSLAPKRSLKRFAPIRKPTKAPKRMPRSCPPN